MVLQNTVGQSLHEYFEAQRLPDQFAKLVTDWYGPLAKDLTDYHVQANRPLMIGINGAQGSGKSTLSSFLAHLLNREYQCHSIDLSIDDFYLTRPERRTLAERVHPMLNVRGVPGTHDVTLMNETLDALLKGTGECHVPCFDKSTDDRCPQHEWQQVRAPVDVVIMEGWCLGTRVQDDADLDMPVNSLESKEDPDGVWRHYVNEQIKDYYEPLYDKVDIWIMLQAPSFDCVFEWRLEQESKLADSLQASAGMGASLNRLMSASDVKRFIQYYQRLTEHTLATLPARVNYRYQLDANRQVVLADRPQPVVLS